MSQVLPSGKTGANKYDLRTNDPNKVLPRLDVRQIAQNNQRAYQQTQGYSLSGNEGAASAIDGSLSIIDDTTIGNYDDSMAKMIQTYVANASRLIVDGGSTANSLILNPPVISPGNSPNGTDYSEATSLPFAYKEGLRFTFLATLSNTGAVQVQIPGLSGLVGSVDLVDQDGNDLVANDIVVNNYYTIIAKNISGDKFILNKTEINPATTTQSGQSLLPQQITISNGTDTDHDIDFTAGNFQFDDGTGQAVATALTKQIDAAWAEGDNAGGLDTGSIAADTFYYLFAIYNPTSTISDYLFSTSSSSPTMPSGYTKKKRIASLLTDGSGNIRNGTYMFFQGGYEFEYDAEIQDAFHTNDSGSSNYTISVPLVPCKAYVRAEAVNDAINANAYINLGTKGGNISLLTGQQYVGISTSNGYILIPDGDATIYKTWGGSSNRRVWQYTLGWIEYIN